MQWLDMINLHWVLSHIFVIILQIYIETNTRNFLTYMVNLTHFFTELLDREFFQRRESIKISRWIFVRLRLLQYSRRHPTFWALLKKPLLLKVHSTIIHRAHITKLSNGNFKWNNFKFCFIYVFFFSKNRSRLRDTLRTLFY